jgi:hypothetical protein
MISKPQTISKNGRVFLGRKYIRINFLQNIGNGGFSIKVKVEVLHMKLWTVERKNNWFFLTLKL